MTTYLESCTVQLEQRGKTQRVAITTCALGCIYTQLMIINSVQRENIRQQNQMKCQICQAHELHAVTIPRRQPRHASGSEMRAEINDSPRQTPTVN